VNLKAIVTFLGIGSLIFWSAIPAEAGFSDFLKGIQDTLKGSHQLSESEITRGLKEALEIGTKNAVKLVSVTNGYYKNPKIKIPLPQTVQQMAPVMQAVGLKKHLTRFEKSMNRAAEKAAPEARKIFWDAIGKMTFGDARKILDGPDNAATLYFKDKTWTRLQQIFEPIVKSAMARVGVTKYYQDINIQLRRYPFVDKMTVDLDAYVTEKALQGLFIMLAKEEKEIRSNPRARVTELLKKVFAEE